MAAAVIRDFFAKRIPVAGELIGEGQHPQGWVDAYCLIGPTATVHE